MERFRKLASFLPVGDLSVWMMSIVVLSTIVWLAYGFGIENGGPVIVANSIVLALSLLLLYFKYAFNKNTGPK